MQLVLKLNKELYGLTAEPVVHRRLGLGVGVGWGGRQGTESRPRRFVLQLVLQLSKKQCGLAAEPVAQCTRSTQGTESQHAFALPLVLRLNKELQGLAAEPVAQFSGANKV